MNFTSMRLIDKKYFKCFTIYKSSFYFVETGERRVVGEKLYEK